MQLKVVLGHNENEMTNGADHHHENGFHNGVEEELGNGLKNGTASENGCENMNENCCKCEVCPFSFS